MNKLIKFLYTWLPPIIWASVIFYFSSGKTGQASSVVWQDFAAKKFAHIFIYAVLAALLFRSLRRSNQSLFRSFWIALIVSIAYGISDEVHQSFTPGREPHIRDVGFDTIGATLGLLTLCYIKQIMPKRLSNLVAKLDPS